MTERVTASSASERVSHAAAVLNGSRRGLSESESVWGRHDSLGACAASTRAALTDSWGLAPCASFAFWNLVWLVVYCAFLLRLLAWCYCAATATTKGSRSYSQCTCTNAAKRRSSNSSSRSSEATNRTESILHTHARVLCSPPPLPHHQLGITRNNGCSVPFIPRLCVCRLKGVLAVTPRRMVSCCTNARALETNAELKPVLSLLGGGCGYGCGGAGGGGGGTWYVYKQNYLTSTGLEYKDRC